MIYKAHIPHKLPTLNEYIRIARGNKYASNKVKQDAQRLIIPYLKNLPEITSNNGNKVDINITWLCGDKKNDPDNIAFAKKMILDALVKSKKLETDGARFINGFRDKFVYSKEWGVIVEIEEVNDEH